jgi:hypothetical protein
MASPLEELRDRLRAEAAQWNGEYKTYGDVFRNGKDEGLKYAADELDKIIEGMCDVALMECDRSEWEECYAHHTTNDLGRYQHGKFQPTDNLQPRGE